MSKLDALHMQKFLPGLAMSIGLTGAIIIQELHELLKTSNENREGRRWVCKTAEQWHKLLPYYSITTIKKALYELEKCGCIISKKFDAGRFNQRKYYSIDYVVLENVL